MTRRIFLFRKSAPWTAVSVLCVLASLSCTGVSTPIDAPSNQDAPLPERGPTTYRLMAGDEISIVFWGNPELDQDLTIRPDGMISMPFIDEIQAASLTPAELDSKLTSLYQEELATPEITVIVQSVSSNVVWVGGEVKEQGTVEMRGQLTLMQALTEAGGLLTTSRENEILVIRTEASGERIARKIDMRPVRSGADPMADVLLQPLDIVFVPRTKIENLALTTDYIYRILPIDFRVNLGRVTVLD